MVTVTVKDIFENMDYGNEKENFDLVKAWIKRNGLKIPKSTDEIENEVQKSENRLKSWINVSTAERAKLLYKFADEIEKHSTLICQIELYVRQILTKDTKSKSITLIVDYLRYYGGWAYVIEKHLTNYKPYGLCGAYLSDFTPLVLVGAVLAPALAAGNSIIFGVSSTMIPIMSLLLELSQNIGIPEGVISVVHVPNFQIFLNHKSISKLTIIGNLSDTIINDFKVINDKNLTTLHLGKSTAIVFDTADFDSACDSIIESALSYRGMFPCGINKVYIQESIFNELVERIKTRILKLNVGYPSDLEEKNIDFIVNEIQTNISVDIINKIPLQIGYTTFGSSVLLKEDDNTLSLTAFRTAKEAIALANNTNFNLATSVWTENISLANELTLNLKNNIIWVNTHGYIDANIAFSPTKDSGCGYFGGKDGLLEYMTCDKPSKLKTIVYETSVESYLPKAVSNKRKLIYYGGSFKKSESGLTVGDNELSNRKDIRNCVDIAKKSYEIWSKIQPKVRSQYLLKLADVSTSLKIRNTALLKNWIECLREYAVVHSSEILTVQQSNPELKIVNEPLGIIAMNIDMDEKFVFLKLIISAIISGNSVIVINCTNDMDEFLLELCKIFPLSGIMPGILNVIFESNTDIIETLLTHREIQTYFNSTLAVDIKGKQITCKQMQKLKPIRYVNNSYDVLKLVTSNKCIYTNTGESFL